MQAEGAVHLELIRDRSRDFPPIHAAGEYTSARVWHCAYRTLAPLAAFVNLRSLEIATFPDATLAPLAGLVRLESLGILDMRRISDLSPLRGLNALTRLSLATPPSWDSSGKVIEIHSLAPLNDLPLLADLELFGVCPPSGRVDDLMAIASLRHVRLSKYPRSEIERLYREVARRTELDG